jgi:hypothetical protein
LQSNNPCNKVKAEVHQESGKLSIKFTVDKIIPEFEMGAKKIHLDWAHSFMSSRTYFRGSTRLPGSRFSTRSFQSQTTQQLYPLSMIAHLRRTFIMLWRSSSKKLFTRKSPGIASNYNVKKKLLPSPIGHLH